MTRDRENCTVFVADLPKGATEEEIKALFEDVGITMLYLVITTGWFFFNTVRQSAGGQVHTVKKFIGGHSRVFRTSKSSLYYLHLFWSLIESMMQDSVPAALTKDKKRLRRKEIAVHLAWKSTLYVTNFPELADDTVIRELFGQVKCVNDE